MLSNTRLGEQFKLKVGEIMSIKSELKEDRASQKEFAKELEASQRETAKVKKVNMALLEENLRARSALQVGLGHGT